MHRLDCPYLGSPVELSDERADHIARRHPELSNNPARFIAETLLDPEEIRSDSRFPRTRLFSRWFKGLLEGKILVVAVVTDEPDPDNPESLRHWVVTAYPTDRVTQGVIEWKRP